MILKKILPLLMCGSALLQSQSQSLLQVYRPFIPAAYLDSAEIVSIITNNLQAAAGTDPELIYDFLRSFESEEQTFNTEQFRAYLLNFSEKRKKRSEWAQSELQRLDQNKQDLNLHRVSKAFYQDLVVKERSERTPSPEISPPDTNKRDFIVYQYYSSDTKLHYDPTQNYSAMRNQFENAFVDSFRNYCDQFTADPDTTKCGRLVKQVTGSWYIFDRNEKNGGTPFSPSELVSIYYRQKYSYTDERSSFGIGALYQRTSLFSVDLIMPDNPYGIIYSKFPFTADQAGLSLFYRYRIKPIKTFLGYAKFGFSYFEIRHAHDGSVSLFLTKRYYPNQYSDLQVDYFYPHASISITSFSSTTFNVAAPFLYVNEDILLELGAGVSLNTMKYYYSYFYNLYTYAVGEYFETFLKKRSGSGGDASLMRTMQKIQFHASINIVWNVYGGLNLQYSIGPRQASLSVQQFF